MGTGVLTATLMGLRSAPGAALLRSIAPLAPMSGAISLSPAGSKARWACAASMVCTALAGLRLPNIFAAGATFGYGLALSGMTQQRKARQPAAATAACDPRRTLRPPTAPPRPISPRRSSVAVPSARPRAAGGRVARRCKVF